ncbi:preprotein translocase subunit SecA [Kitasatospora sp. MAP12-15]|nr:preprotein translocase subunit SecA [Kitasatospora sp. MAP12-44]
MTDVLRRRLSSGAEWEQGLAEAAALVRETVRRVLGLRLDDAQLIGGIALHHGSLVEMRTGEGKTLTIALPAYLGALTGGAVHVMTANDYLADRDATQLKPIYGELGMSCGLVTELGGGGAGWEQRRAAYGMGITYGTPGAFACDYLRDSRALDQGRVMQRGRRLAIVDEADLTLLDRAREQATLRERERCSDPACSDPVYGRLTALVRRLRPDLQAPGRSRTLAAISLRQYLLGYAKLTAITAVATEAEVYEQIYGLDTVPVATTFPIRRIDQPVRFFPDDGSRIDAAVRETARRQAAGQPVLLATASIAQTEQLSAALRAADIPHRALSTKNHCTDSHGTNNHSTNHHAEQAPIITRAGRSGAVTVVTRLAGRGVDIPLGGDRPDERAPVARSGGLYVLAVDVFESRRFALQVRGRAGRRGDPGESAVFAALTDTSLISLLGTRNIQLLAAAAADPENRSKLANWALERALNTRTEQATQRLCGAVRYDEVVGAQLDRIQRQRRALFEGGPELARWVRSAIGSVVERQVRAVPPERLHAALAGLYPVGLTAAQVLDALPAGELAARLRADAQRAYDGREAELSPAVLRRIERYLVLTVINLAWPEHHEALSDLYGDTNLYSLAGGDYLARFQQEAARLFTALREQIERETVALLFKLSPQDVADLDFEEGVEE